MPVCPSAVVCTCMLILVFFLINFEDNFFGPLLPVSMKFILIKLPDQQQKKTNNTFSHLYLACELQTYFWALLLCKNVFFGGREVTTGKIHLRFAGYHISRVDFVTKDFFSAK